MNAPTKPKQGWGWPYSARCEHYFLDNSSLCGQWTADRVTLTAAHVIGPKTCSTCAQHHGKDNLS